MFRPGDTHLPKTRQDTQ
ncbi:hypothetical protein E2C01_096674 [Portunus trituberculatus]|uniref:Uncharacterized protein n=1 Tax=Portunus trituberculatus TaxID=210409 RepID=A0A5B7K7G2_PORTR|nr:hypothetical protein [Portunus trituberculatus]